MGGKPRAMLKLLYKYNGQALFNVKDDKGNIYERAGLQDLLRASFIFKDFNNMQAAVQLFLNGSQRNDIRYPYVVTRMKDRFAEPGNGYKDVHMNIVIGEIAAEIQFRLLSVYELKNSGGHKGYKSVRLIPDGPKGKVYKMLRKQSRCAKDVLKEKEERAVRRRERSASPTRAVTSG